VITVMLVAAGSALGAPTRFLIDQFIQRSHERILPWGTWTINVTGAFLLGMLMGSATRLELDTLLLAAAGTGFLGAYTTFSTFTWETMRLVEDGAFLAALGNIVLSVIAGIVAVSAGVALSLLW